MTALQEPRWTPLTLGDLELSVTTDYLRDTEGVLWCPFPDEASEALEAFEAILPTPTLVDAIEAVAKRIPFTAFVRDKQTRATAVASSLACDRYIDGYQGLVACHGKDIVVGQTRRSHPAKVAIYGARWASGGRVQPLFPPLRSSHVVGHALRYRDYSHKARGVRIAARYKGQARSIFDCFQDPNCIRRLNQSGVLLEQQDLTYAVRPKGTR